jgi:hypothetical protein
MCLVDLREPSVPQGGTFGQRNAMPASGLVYLRESTMPKSNREPITRHAAEDTSSGASPDEIEQTPVFDRAGLAPKI